MPCNTPDIVPEEFRPISKAAVVTLLCGFLGFITVGTTGVVALIIGALGHWLSDWNQVRGRRLMTAGMVAGLISILAWGGYGLNWWVQTAPQRTVARRLLDDLSTGNYQDARSICTAHIKKGDLAYLIQQFKNWGGLYGSFLSVNMPRRVGGGWTTDCEFTLQFVSGRNPNKRMPLTEVQDNGDWKIDTYKLDRF